MLLCKCRRERIQRSASRRTFYYSKENALAYYNIRPTRSGKRPFLFSFAEKISVQLCELLFALYTIMPPSSYARNVKLFYESVCTILASMFKLSRQMHATLMEK